NRAINFYLRESLLFILYHQYSLISLSPCKFIQPSETKQKLKKT
ncbi:unnamed protein product, partial [Brassica oleracea]